MNNFQKEFMEAMADIQEWAVTDSLYGKHHNFNSMEERLYEITAETICKIMELIDGYGNSSVGKLDVISKTTGENLKELPFIELHDVVCNYLKGC